MPYESDLDLLPAVYKQPVVVDGVSNNQAPLLNEVQQPAGVQMYMLVNADAYRQCKLHLAPERFGKSQGGVVVL